MTVCSNVATGFSKNYFDTGSESPVWLTTNTGDSSLSENGRLFEEMLMYRTITDIVS